MKTLKKSLWGAAALAVVTACSGGMETPKNSNKIEQEDGVVTVTADLVNLNAEELATAAVAGLTLDTLQTSRRLLKMAISADPQNFKANLFDKLLAVSDSVEGALGTQNSSVFPMDLSGLGHGQTYKFLTQNGSTIRTYEDVQIVASQSRDALIDLYRYMRENSDKTLMVSHIALMVDKSATMSVNETEEQLVLWCRECSISSVTLSQADLLGLRQYVAALALYGVAMTSYSLGEQNIDMVSSSKEESLDQLEQVVSIMENGRSQGGGDLRADNKLGFLLELAADFKPAYRMAKQWVGSCSDLDGQGDLTKVFCGEVDEQTLELVDQAAKGPVVVDGVTIDVKGFIERPVTNFVEAVEINSCGYAVFGEQFYSVLFPNSSAEEAREFVGSGGCSNDSFVRENVRYQMPGGSGFVE